ncbi:hypothetical protein AXG93_1154s1450 [Marchantia polymorpha subsp. ruderalis]|uniref:Uncharacterized protein n=1 Tax=Marchantia polymorpha subsp. ruderalis TaxID=1480154 RepID=A0A176WSW0_MARPO|nr:hypothetical protein AXG93_1154s1450 [Marchantia polymorpha subsp. ruderalis]
MFFHVVTGLESSSSSQISLAGIPSGRSLATRVNGRVVPQYGQQYPKRGLVVYADYNGRRGGGAGDFVAGFLLGGALFGAIGYLIAPTVNKTLAAAAAAEKEKEDVEDEGPPKKLPKYLEDDEGLEVRTQSDPHFTKLLTSVEDDEGLEKTRKSLNEKIAQLNAAIDDVSAQLRAEEGAFSNVNDSAVELESAA